MSAIALDKITVGSLRSDVQGPLRELAGRLVNDLGDNLTSMAVVGSVLTGDFHPRESDINTVVVVGQGGPEVLRTLAGYGKELGPQRLRAPWVMTREFIGRATDVFGVELLDFQLNHVLVYGADPFRDMAFGKQQVRLQCERELRTAEIQLGQGYLRGLGLHSAVEPLLEACAGKLVPLLRAMLWLVDLERPRETKPTLEKAGQAFGLDDKMIEVLVNLKRKEERRGADIVELLFRDVYRIVDHLCLQVDQLKIDA